jgi:hypothetical protein
MSGNPHPWRIMAVVFGGVLLSSFLLQELFSPAGDAVVRAVDGRPVVLTGTIAVPPAKAGLVIHGDHDTYTLAEPAKAQAYAGRKVRITGTLHDATGLLEIYSITSVLDDPANTQ